MTSHSATTTKSARYEEESRLVDWPITDHAGAVTRESAARARHQLLRKREQVNKREQLREREKERTSAIETVDITVDAAGKG